MTDHKHKIGVRGRSGQYRFGCECGKNFEYMDAMVYIERYMGDEVGRKYWVSLRMLLDNLRYERNKNKIFSEGYIYPKKIEKNL